MATDADFIALLSEAKIGNAEAEQQLVRNNLPLVYAIAKRFTGRGVETEDLHQLGAIGLLKAIRRFDVSYDVCFSTYAVPMIAGEMKRFLRDDGIIRFSRSVKELAVQIRKLQQEHAEITVRELARMLNAEDADIAAAIASTSFPKSLDEPDPLTGDPFGVSVPAEERETETDNRLLIDDLLNSLDEREQFLIRARYFGQKTQAETGRMMGISQVQVSRLEKKALLKLRLKTEDKASAAE